MKKPKKRTRSECAAWVMKWTLTTHSNEVWGGAMMAEVWGRKVGSGEGREEGRRRGGGKEKVSEVMKRMMER